MSHVEQFNRQSLPEEIFNAVSHGVGAVLAVVGTIVLILSAWQYGDRIGIVSSAIYGSSLILLYLMSTLYHSITHHGAKRVFQVFDHCSIFLLILGSYAPICLSLLGGTLGWVLFGFNLFFTVLGVVFNAVSVKRWHKLSLVLYLLMGWSVVFALRPMLAAVSAGGFALLLAGGLCYSVGVIFYKSKHRFMHAVWHMFVLAGSITHYFFMLFYIIRPR